MILQLEELILNPQIIIIDNKSTCIRTFKYLIELKNKYKIIDNEHNYGHNAWFLLLDSLPRRFIVTDPDLLFNKNMPANFIDILLELNEKYKTSRIGFALDISEPELMFPYSFEDYGYDGITTICDSQKVYWEKKIPDDKYELYEAEIDTTFFMFDKENQYTGISIRIAGLFTMKHLPWYIDNVPDLSRYERMMMYNDSNDSSSIKHFEFQYLSDNNYVSIKKSDEIYLIQLSGDDSDNYWIDIFPTWEDELFDLFNVHLEQNKQYLDIGSWIGSTAIYATRKVSEVVCVESDPVSIIKLKRNIDVNRTESIVHIEEKAIFNEEGKFYFGRSNHSNTSQYNDSMSQLKIEKKYEDDILVETITFGQIIKKYNLTNLCFIKIDIEGGEEHILTEVLDYIFTHNIPTYISFHYEWWIDKDLDRFPFDNEIKQKIKLNPFCSILFK